MKKTTMLIVCMGTIFCSYAQETPSETSNAVPTKQEYLRKSKAQKSGAIILISVGGALIIAGAATAVSNVNYNIDIFGNGQTNQNTNNDETLSDVLALA